MMVIFTELFRYDYNDLPANIQRALDKALKFLLENPHHPSLRAKRLPGTLVWYARVSRAYRFTFQFEADVIILRHVGTHDILKKERRRGAL